MPLKGIPTRIHPELLYALARMGHGDKIVIADANFPSDSVATSTVLQTPIRVQGLTSEVLKDILQLFPLDSYSTMPIIVMDRVISDKTRNLIVPAYGAIATVCAMDVNSLHYMERFEFYEMAKSSFAVIQTDDITLYANVIISKGIIS